MGSMRPKVSCLMSRGKNRDERREGQERREGGKKEWSALKYRREEETFVGER